MAREYWHLTGSERAAFAGMSDEEKKKFDLAKVDEDTFTKGRLNALRRFMKEKAAQISKEKLSAAAAARDRWTGKFETKKTPSIRF